MQREEDEIDAKMTSKEADKASRMSTGSERMIRDWNSETSKARRNKAAEVRWSETGRNEMNTDETENSKKE